MLHVYEDVRNVLSGGFGSLKDTYGDQLQVREFHAVAQTLKRFLDASGAHTVGDVYYP